MASSLLCSMIVEEVCTATSELLFVLLIFTLWTLQVLYHLKRFHVHLTKTGVRHWASLTGCGPHPSSLGSWSWRFGDSKRSYQELALFPQSWRDILQSSGICYTPHCLFVILLFLILIILRFEFEFLADSPKEFMLMSHILHGKKY